MLRVLNVISGLNKAGTEAVVMNYYRHIDRSKIQFDFLVLDKNEDLYYEHEINDLGGLVYKIHPFKKNPLRNILERRKFFKVHKYQIVEVHSPSALRFAYCRLAKKNGSKVIFHVHNSSKNSGLIVKYARKQIKKYCDETVTCSQNAALSVLGEMADKVVYNAINKSNYIFNQKVREFVREHYGVANDEVLIGTIGRFCIQKNQPFLIEVFAGAVKKNEKLKLFIRGSGDVNEIIASIEKCGVSNHVILSAEETDVIETQNLYNAFDLFALPSLYEGLPVVAIEAQINCLPSIFSDAITDEVVISKTSKRLPLEKEIWINELATGVRRNEKNAAELLNCNYDIEKQAKIRENEYLEM